MSEFPPGPVPGRPTGAPPATWSAQPTPPPQPVRPSQPAPSPWSAPGNGSGRAIPATPQPRPGPPSHAAPPFTGPPVPAHRAAPWPPAGASRIPAGRSIPPPTPARAHRRPDIGRIVAGAILVGLGGAVARAVLDDSYTAYVRPVMRLPLALTALVLIVAGVAGYVSGVKTGQPAGHTPPGSDHEHRHGVSRAALLALVPLAVLALVHPPALDDAATTRVAQAATQPAADSGVQVEPLAGDPGTPKQMTFNELSIRANASNGPPTLNGRTLSVEGFVSKDQKGAPAGTIRVGRYMIWCCAADATYGAAFVQWPTGTGAPATGSWFTVVGRVQSFTTANFVAVPVLTAQAVRAERAPKQQYEY